MAAAAVPSASKVADALSESFHSLYNAITLGMIASLERRPRVVDVKLAQVKAASSSQVGVWESSNGIRLPSDFKDFLQVANGMYAPQRLHVSQTSREAEEKRIADSIPSSDTNMNLGIILRRVKGAEASTKSTLSASGKDGGGSGSELAQANKVTTC
eukprot:gene12641-13196_t